MFERLVEVDPAACESALIERIAELERSSGGGQVRAAGALDAMRRADEAAAGVPAAQRGRGVASEVALARRDSPARGGRHLGLAKALVHEMPHALAALECGALSEWRATTPTAHTYRSAAPPRAPAITVSDIEVRVGIALAKHAA
jgi:hypothetical protein